MADEENAVSHEGVVVVIIVMEDEVDAVAGGIKISLDTKRFLVRMTSQENYAIKHPDNGGNLNFWIKIHWP